MFKLKSKTTLWASFFFFILTPNIVNDFSRFQFQKRETVKAFMRLKCQITKFNVLNQNVSKRFQNLIDLRINRPRLLLNSLINWIRAKKNVILNY